VTTMVQESNGLCRITRLAKRKSCSRSSISGLGHQVAPRVDGAEHVLKPTLEMGAIASEL
jgi:hypothetical protein